MRVVILQRRENEDLDSAVSRISQVMETHGLGVIDPPCIGDLFEEIIYKQLEQDIDATGTRGGILARYRLDSCDKLIIDDPEQNEWYLHDDTNDVRFLKGHFRGDIVLYQIGLEDSLFKEIEKTIVKQYP